MDLLGNGSALLIALVLWTLPWKLWACWLAARRGEKIWFAILFIFNTLAILEIIYIFMVAKRSDQKEEKPAEPEEYTLPGHGTN